jgi:hypothetical protein
MKSTNQDIVNKQELTEPWQRQILRKRVRWFATLIAGVALSAAVTAPVAVAATKRFVDSGNGTVTDTQMAQADAPLAEIASAGRRVHAAIGEFDASLLDLGDPSVRVIFSMTNRLDAKAHEVVTIAALLGVHGLDPDEVVSLVLMEMAEDMEHDLRMMLAEVVAMNAAKKKLQDLPDRFNQDAAEVEASVRNLIALIRCRSCD